jgi:hypothetical protein
VIDSTKTREWDKAVISMGVKMPRIFIAWIAIYIAAAASPANAYSIGYITEISPPAYFLLDGTPSLTSDVTTGPAYPGPVPQNVGPRFLLEMAFSDESANVISNSSFSSGLIGPNQGAVAYLDTLVATSTGLTIGPGVQMNPTYATFSYSSNSLSASMSGNFTSSNSFALSLTGNGTTFDGSLILTSGLSSRDIQFEADGLQLNSVSVVPLPPALPMFASALLALGLFGVYARRGKRDSVEMAV